TSPRSSPNAWSDVKDLLLLLPRLARMIASLLADRAVPIAAKLALGAVALYLASPIDLIPDFIPFVGYLDDLVVAAIVLDGIENFVDRSVLLRYWPGSPASLDATAAVARRLAAWVPSRGKRRVFGGQGLARGPWSGSAGWVARAGGIGSRADCWPRSGAAGAERESGPSPTTTRTASPWPRRPR